MISAAQTATPVPLDIVGSSLFGRHPKISAEQTLNMFTADNASINFAGYQFQVPLLERGRGLFASDKAQSMFAVSDNKAYKLGTDLTPVPIGDMQTSSGDVFIDEDILGNVAFCDGTHIYIYNYINGLSYIAGSAITDVGAVISPLDFVPNYVCFHDGRFIATSASSGGNQIGQWRLSTTKVVDGKTYIYFPSSSQFQGGFQTKADLPVAVARFPGRRNQILVIGSIVAEVWTDRGLALFPYEINTSFNVDFGCLNPATVCELNNIVVWLGGNERSGPVIMYTTGQDVQQISTDGYDARFERLVAPETCYAFTYRQAGHMFYVVTFYDPRDNISLAYDFKTGKFYTLTDESLNHYIAKRTVSFNNTYYFISINDGDIYELNSEFNTYEYDGSLIQEIPRQRICKTFRTPGSVPRVFNDLWFILEQGIDEQNTGQGNNIAEINMVTNGQDYTACTVLIEGDGKGAEAHAILDEEEVIGISLVDPGIGYTWAVVTLIGDGTDATCEAKLNVNNYVPRVDISASYDGGYTWSNFDQMELTRYGNFKNRFYYNGLGYGNEITLQFRYWCKSRFVCFDGEMTYY